MGIMISTSVENSIPNESMYVDGTDFSGIVRIGGVIGSKMMGTLVVFGSFVIDAFIWLIYGIAILIFGRAKK